MWGRRLPYKRTKNSGRTLGSGATKVNAALSSTTGNAQEVADAVLRIIETPAGEKQLRYFVSSRNIGVDEINALTKQVQAKVLQGFGLAADTKFLKGKAVGSV